MLTGNALRKAPFFVEAEAQGVVDDEAKHGPRRVGLLYVVAWAGQEKGL